MPESTASTQANNEWPFLLGGGEMGRLIRENDWSRASLGSPQAWPEALKTLSSLMLGSRQPMFIIWGPGRIWLNNDAFLPILGRKHPHALGQSALAVWGEARADLEPLFDQVFAGEPVHMDDIMLQLDRRSGLEEAHFAYSYTPVRDESGKVAGLFGVCTETTERFLAAQRSDEQLVSLAGLFDQAPGFMCMLRGTDHVFERMNPAYRQLVGHRDLIGKPIREALPEIEGQGFFELLNQVFRTGEAFSMAGAPVELQSLPDGALERRFLDFVYQPIQDATGAVTGIFVEGSDVTERTRAEARREALIRLTDAIGALESEEDLAFAAAGILGEIMAVDRVGYGEVNTRSETISIKRDWNAPGVETLAGTLKFRDYGSYIVDLARGDTVVIEDAHDDPRTADTADALTAINARAFINMPVTERGGLVALLYLNHSKARAWPSEDLALVREFAARVRTATERLRVTAALRETEARLTELNTDLARQVEEKSAERDRLWRNSQDLLAVVGGDGVFLAANPAWQKILGWREAEVVGKDHLFFNHPDHHAQSAQALETAMRSHLPSYENRVLHKDGSYRWISWVASAEGGLVYASGRDVTAEHEAREELDRTQEALRQSQKMEAVGQLTGGIAHDFNNLLGGISGSFELLEARLQQGRFEGLERYLNTGQEATRRAAALTQRLLAFSRRQTLDPRPLDANRMLAGISDLVQRSVGPNIQVEVVQGVGLWTTKVDQSQLENAILNLCINARDAMPGGGTITIETANKWLDDRTARARDLVPGQYISLCVSDTGTGIPSELVDKVFDPFFTTKPLGQGTGLGLSMIYGFVRQSGGQVRIYSEVGKGTTMCLYLPRFMGPAETEEDADDLPVDPGFGETVLIIDDEMSIRTLVTEVLQDNGYRVIEAEDGPSGLKILETDQRIDLLITDVGLPGGLNGRQVADAARVRRPDLKVLFITGYAENAAIGNGHLDPGMAVMTKPFVMNALANKVRELIDS